VPPDYITEITKILATAAQWPIHEFCSHNQNSSGTGMDFYFGGVLSHVLKNTFDDHTLKMKKKIKVMRLPVNQPG
jgi:hypothetical protein